MENDKPKLIIGLFYRPAAYAAGVGCHPSRITHLYKTGRLKVRDHGAGLYQVQHCRENMKLFPRKFKTD